MAVLLALALTVTVALDPEPIPPPYAPPADEMPAAEDPAPEVEPEPEPEEEVVQTVPLPGPRAYLYRNYPGLAPVLDCMIRLESSWDPGASRNRPYLGLAQFDYPTWMETPQGKRGYSRTDPYASIDAMAWGVRNLGYGRWPVTSRRCR